MTISSTNRVAGPFIGDGSTATFPFTFKVFDESDLLVVRQDAAGAITELVLTSDYSVALNADQDSSPGGSVTLTAGNLASGLKLTITTDIVALQGLDLTNGGGFYPDVINAALDRLTVLIQQLEERAARALQMPFGDIAETTLPAGAERAGKVLMFDGAGNVQLVSVAAGSIVPGSQAAVGAIDGVNKVFTFTAAAGTPPSVIVFAAGIYQTLATDYSLPAHVSGTTWSITFTDAPTDGPIRILMLS